MAAIDRPRRQRGARLLGAEAGVSRPPARARGDVRFVYLKGDRATIAPRLAARAGHYMPATLLASQFATLEEPADAIVIDIRHRPRRRSRRSHSTRGSP